MTAQISNWPYQVSASTLLAVEVASFGENTGEMLETADSVFSLFPRAAKLSRIEKLLAPLGVGATIAGLLFHSVDAATGQLFLQGKDELDFVLEGEFPFYWQRYYLSSYSYQQGVLGQGWSLPWESTLVKVADGIMWRSLTGDLVAFPEIPVGHQVYCSEYQYWLTRSEEDEWYVRGIDGKKYHYAAFDTSEQSPLQAITDSRGRRQTFIYDDQLRVITIETDSAILRCEYNSNSNRLTAVWQQTEQGEVLRVRYLYNEMGQLSSVHQQGEKLARLFGWNSEGRLIWHINSLGLRCDYLWKLDESSQIYKVVSYINSEGLAVSLIYSQEKPHCQASYYDGSQAEWYIDSFTRQVVSYRNRLGSWSHLEWDEYGQPKGYVTAEKYVRSCRWDEYGRLCSTKNANGHEKRWQYYKGTDWPMRIIWPDETKEEYRRDRSGRVVVYSNKLQQSIYYAYPDARSSLPSEVTDILGRKTHLEWNKQGKLIKHTSVIGQVTEWAYDELGQLKKHQDAEGKVTFYQWDEMGYLTTILLPDESKIHLKWTPEGELAKYQHGEQAAREWQYNALGLPIIYTDRLQRVIQYSYSEEGYLLSINNANGGEYLFTYDAEGRLLTESRPDDTFYQYRYSSDGLLLEEIRHGQENQEGQRLTSRIQMSYDAVGQLLSRYTETEEASYQWDMMGNLIRAKKLPTENGSTLGIETSQLSMEYDVFGRITAEISTLGTLRYNYDDAGNLSSLILPDGDEIGRDYYEDNQVRTIRFNQELLTEFTYDALRREQSRTQGALTYFRQYDILGRRAWHSSAKLREGEKSMVAPEQGVLWRKYHYNGCNELVKIEDSSRSIVDYDYDEEGRLRCTVTTNDSNFKLHYDQADNLLLGVTPVDPAAHKMDVSISYPSNRQLRWERWHYFYDTFGNLVRRREGYSPQTYLYDADNRLIRAKGDGPRGRFEAQYHYDALGRRIRKDIKSSVGQSEVQFLWQGMRLLAFQNEARRQVYCYDPAEPHVPLACIERIGRENKFYYYHPDLNGSPEEVSDKDGYQVWSGQYGPFGQVTRKTDAMLQNVRQPWGDFKQLLRYAGQFLDEESGLHYSLYRYYLPETGRYMTPNPRGVAGSLNLYNYAPNPLRWMDPLGLSSGQCYRQSIEELSDIEIHGKILQEPAANIPGGPWYRFQCAFFKEPLSTDATKSLAEFL